MNPFNLDVPSTPRNLLPNHPNINNCMENTSRTNNEWGTYCEFSRHTNDETQRSMGVHVGWQGSSLPSHTFYNMDSDVEDSDGGTLEMEEEDPELSRKRKELQQIEERIILKKAAIALKTVELLVNKKVPSDSCNDHSATREGQTLKDRVNLILKQRHPPSFLSKVRERMNSSSLSRERPLQDNHPLKLRVNALLKQRCSSPVLPANREVPDVTLPLASESITSPANEENDINKGFQRFLSVLNKGVDMDFLSKIVTDDNEDLPLGKELLIVQPPTPENTSDPASMRESQHSNSVASLPGCSQTNCEERKTDLLSKERSFNDRLSLHYDKEMRNDGENRCFGSSSRSKSPSAVKKRQKKEEKQPKVDKQPEHLQNILKTQRLSLEVEEMNKLAHRTQERLYGKKQEDTRVDSRGDQESQQRSSQRHYSISSSSSASSRSTRSRGSSPSTSQHQCSHSRDSKQWFEHSCSRGRSSDRLKRRDDNQDGKEAQSYRDKDNKVMLPLSGSIASPANEENDINKGFQRFLSLLNKGVDMDLLSRIVTDDSEDLPLGKQLIVQPSALEKTSDPASMSESQQSSSGASLAGGSRTNGGERKTDLPSQEKSLNKRLSLHYDEEKTNDGGNRCFGSSSRSKSPVKKKKKKEEEQPKVDEQKEHLQNILKTLGLSLEVEEINKLAHRTQERLYGKKQEDTRVDSRGDQESQPRSSQRHSSISSSSSASSRSTRSRSPSPGTSQQWCSHSLSRGRSRDRLKPRDDHQDSKEAQSYRDKDDKEISTYQHPYPQNQTYPQYRPAALGYSLSQDSEYYNANTNSYWTHGTTPSSLNPLGNFHHFPGPVKPSNMVYPNPNACEDYNLLMNPDLSKSEGQIGPLFGPRCLQVISTKQSTNDRCLMQLTKSHRKRTSLAWLKMAKTKAKKKRRKWKKKVMHKQKELEAKLSAKFVKKAEVPWLGGDKDDSKDEQPEAEKMQPTEEEIKSRLRKWLEAYNQKMKQKNGTTIQLSTLSSPPLD